MNDTSSDRTLAERTRSEAGDLTGSAFGSFSVLHGKIGRCAAIEAPEDAGERPAVSYSATEAGVTLRYTKKDGATVSERCSFGW